MGDPRPEQHRCPADACGCADKLRRHVADGIATGDLSQTKERERYGRVVVRTGPTPPGRVDQRCCGQPHRRTHHRAPQRGIREERSHGRGRMLEQ